jgi:hypothetical protein
MLDQHAVEYFWERVKKLDDGCWEWTGQVDRTGVPLTLNVSAKDGRSRRASARRLAWNMIVDPDEIGGIGACAKMKLCVNPQHLKVSHSRSSDITPEQVEAMRRQLVRYLSGQGRGSPRRKVSMY